MNSHLLSHAPRIRNGGFSRRTASLSAAVLTLALAASTLAPGTPEITPSAHAATPVIPDDLPIFPTVTENPQISVTFEDGTPSKTQPSTAATCCSCMASDSPPRLTKVAFPSLSRQVCPMASTPYTEPSLHTGNPARVQIHQAERTHTIAWRGSCQKAPWKVFRQALSTCAAPSQDRSSE